MNSCNIQGIWIFGLGIVFVFKITIHPLHAAEPEIAVPPPIDDWTPVLIAPEGNIDVASGASRGISSTTWKHPLSLHGKLNNPLVEVTPFVFQDRFYLLENWQKHWELSGAEDGAQYWLDEVRIVGLDPNRIGDLNQAEIISTPLVGHGLGMAFVWEGKTYVFAGNWGTGKKWNIKQIEMTSSSDLQKWSNPKAVLTAAENEHFFNVSVCRGRDCFVMLVESNDPTWPAFTFKYFISDDLVHWKPVPDALYGREKYVGGPALYFYNDYYYTLYLQSLGEGRYETRVTRSKDLIHWQDAPEGRPFATFNPENNVHSLRPPEIRETNASDAELCEYRGKTYVFYTGGDQHVAGDLQWATFDGSAEELLESFYSEPEVYVPNNAQLMYQNNQLGAFVHFGPASFTGGDFMQTPDASVFNPEQLDAEQWVLAAKSFGAKHIVLTAKHHAGFCLWPTKTTDYSVKSSPWKNGHGDVVDEFVTAARKHGLQPGLYLSGGDKHFPCTSTPDPLGKRKLQGDRNAYFPVYLEQLREVLTHYGDLATVWMDGAYDPFGWDVKTRTGKPLGTAFGDAIALMIRELQPNAAMMGGTRPDIRWSGSEQGLAPYPIWNVVDFGNGIPVWAPPYYEGWILAEANVHTRSNWFWMPETDSTLKTSDELVAIYFHSIGRGANLLVNLTPDNRGLVPEAEVQRLQEFGEALQTRYSRLLAHADSVDRWMEGNVLELTLEEERSIAMVMLEEDIRYGQRIRAYRLEVPIEGKWQTVAEGRSVGRKRIELFDPPLQTDRIRVRVTDTIPLPKLKNVAVYGGS